MPGTLRDYRVREAQERVREYFRVKTAQLRAASALPSAQHAGLAGSHREELQRIYFSEILPKRYEIGRGMVYGFMHRSREADIVVWDSLNYPSLPMLDHAFFFAESVRAVIESKSRWSADDFADVLQKSKAVRDIMAYPGMNLDDTVAMLQLEVASLRIGKEHDGFLSTRPHIGTAAIFLDRGTSAFADESSIPRRLLARSRAAVEARPSRGQGLRRRWELPLLLQSRRRRAAVLHAQPAQPPD